MARIDRNKVKLCSQSGQGVVEYLMVLMIMLLVILGGVYQLSDAFRAWGEKYFGEYVSCLLETGELPGLGGGVSSGLCNSQFEEFSLASGRPLKNPGSIGGGADGDGSNGSGSGNSPKSSLGAERGGAGGRPGYVRAKRSGAGGSDILGASGKFGGSSKDGKDGGRGRGGSSTYTGSTEDSMATAGLNSRRGPAGGRGKDFDRGFQMDRETETREKGGVAVIVKKGSDNRDLAPKRLRVQKKEAQKDINLEEKEMKFGDYLRWIIIIAIILAMVVFFGGQALQISKSWS